MKYTTGQYILILFTKHGDKAQTIDHTNLMKARAEGEEKIKNPPYASFVVLRVITNSIDTAYPWDVRPEDLPTDLPDSLE